MGSDAACTELGKRLRDDGELLRLERLALGPSNATPTDIQRLPDESLVLLAQALAEGRRGEDALNVLQVLDERELEVDTNLRRLADGRC